MASLNGAISFLLFKWLSISGTRPRATPCPAIAAEISWS
jgi:hypothetical protein